MNKFYTPPKSVITSLLAQHVLCGSGSGWAEMGNYGENTESGFNQVF